MSAILLRVTVIVSAVFVASCSSAPDGKAEADKTRSAMLRVMRQDQELAKKRESLPPNSTPSQIALAAGQYCADMERLDMRDCPADFHVAYRQHLRAWREAHAAIQQLPDSFLEGVFMGAMNAFLRGEVDGGTSRLEGDVKRALERVRRTWEEVEKIGAKYGVVL